MPIHDVLVVQQGRVRTDLACTACKLAENPLLRTNCMQGRGAQEADLMFIGFAPGKEDDQIGKPLTGDNGRLLDGLLAQAGISTDRIYFTNCLKCSPYDTKLTEQMFKACKYHLLKEIRAVKPKALISLGADALQWLTGYSGVKRYRQHSLPCLLAPDLYVFPIHQPAALYHAPQAAKLRAEMLDDLLFIKRRLEDGQMGTTDTQVTDYKTAQTVADVDAFLAEFGPNDEVAVDLETTELHPSQGQVILALGLSKGPGHARAIPIYAWGSITLHYWTDKEVEEEVLPKIRRFLSTRKVYGHNWVQFDQKWLKFMLGIDRTNVCFDVMLAHYLTNEEKGTHDLEQLATEFTTMAPWKKMFTTRDTKQLCEYLCKDVDATARIRPKVEALLTEKQKVLLHKLLVPLGHELMEMEYRGVSIDKENLKRLGLSLKKKMELAQAELRKDPAVQAFEFAANTQVNVNSNDHVATVLEKFLKLPPPPAGRTATGLYRTDKDSLAAYSGYPFVDQVLNIRRLAKLHGTYVEGFDKRVKADGRVHTSYLIHGTVTGRLASQNPNLQNIPRKATAAKAMGDDADMLKAVFTASPGNVLIEADYSQAELRTLAMYCRDPELVRIFSLNLDIHAATAASVYRVPLQEVTEEQRTRAKNVNFGIIYGMHVETLAERFVESGGTKQDAYFFYEEHQRKFPSVWAWMAEQARDVRFRGYQETFFGRRRRYPYITDEVIRQAYNFPIQSTASDFTLFAIVRCANMLRDLNLPAVPLLTVHDSIVFEAAESQADEAALVVKSVMEGLNFWFMNVPMKADFKIGKDWGHLSKLTI